MNTNKRFLILSLIALAGLLACNFGGIVSNVEERIGEFVRGSGNVVEETRSIDGFNAIDLAGVGQVIVEFGSQEALSVEAEDNIIGFIETRVRGRTLVIGIEDNVNLIPTEPIRIFVTAVNLDSVTVSGAGDIQVPEHVTSDFEILLTGLGNFVLEELIADRLAVEIDGSGNVEVGGGEVTEQTVSIAGLGNYEGGDLESQDASVEITGAGNATVWATESPQRCPFRNWKYFLLREPRTRTRPVGSWRYQPLREQVRREFLTPPVREVANSILLQPRNRHFAAGREGLVRFPLQILTSRRHPPVCPIPRGLCGSAIRSPHHRAGPKILFFSTLLLALTGCNYPSPASATPGGGGVDLLLTFAALDAKTPAGGNSLSTPEPPLLTPSLGNPPGLRTATPAAPGNPLFPIPTAGPLPAAFSYIAQSGDTLPSIASRFEIDPLQVGSSAVLPAAGYLEPGTELQIPNSLVGYSYPDALIPDSEVIYSPLARDLDLASFVSGAGGYLAGYTEVLDGRELTGAEVVERVAVERSVNPRLLLALLEYRSGWVYGLPASSADFRHPIGFNVPGYSGLYDELSLTATHLNIGYYNWRTGELNELRFRDGQTARLSPFLNAGSVAVQNLFAKFHEKNSWEAVLYGADSFSDTYSEMFGSPWERASTIEPLLHPGVEQPALELPFVPGETWSFTGGPHRILNLGSPLGALDFSPVTGQNPCASSTAYVTAPAGGVVTRTGDGVLVLDLDGDGFEGTGWVLFFLHISEEGKSPVGSTIEQDDPLGHPSCEGGNATGTHVHIARKYNGEWIAADGPVPFNLGGWVVRQGGRSYEGSLVKGGEVIDANPGGSGSSIIVRN